MKRLNITKLFLVRQLKLKSRTQIAKDLKCSVSTISTTCKKFGINKNTKSKYLFKYFNKLKPIKCLGYDKSSHIKFLCICKCGTETIVRSDSLKSGNTKSCGCEARKRGKNHPLYVGYEELPGRIWTSLKNGAIKRNLEFNITIQYAWNLFLKQNRKCSLSGRKICFSEKTNEQTKTSASLDRIDSSKGYIKGNVQWVHKDVNWIKMNMNEDKFINLCHDISNYQTNKKNNTPNL